MKLTESLKSHMRTKHGLPVDATDETVTKSVSEALQFGKLDASTFAELVQEKAPDAKSAINDAVAKAVSDAMSPLMAQFKTLADAKQAGNGTAGNGGVDIASEIDKAVAAQIAKVSGEQTGGGMAQRAAKIYSMADAKVKRVIDRYSSQRKSLLYSNDSRHYELRGRPVSFEGRSLQEPSTADYAVAGAFLRMAYGEGDRLTEHQQELVAYALHELPWTGLVNNGGIEVNNRLLTEFERKAVLDDAGNTSGGSYAAPQILEDMIVVTPLLYGELFPQVSVMTVTGGRQFRNLTMGRITGTWSGNSIEGSTLDLFDTTGFISTLDTNVFDFTMGIEIGLNWQEDSQIVGMAERIVQLMGREAQIQLDKVIATGDGTTQPQGLTNATGAVSVSSTNLGVGPAVLSDAEGVMLGVNKAHKEGGRNVFVSNETNWRRFSTLPVAAGWNQRMFDPNSYMLYGHMWKIQNDLTNAQLLFFNGRHYQMIRRLGIQFIRETRGATLVRKNLELIVARMRYGGRMLLGGAVAKMTNLPA